LAPGAAATASHLEAEEPRKVTRPMQHAHTGLFTLPPYINVSVDLFSSHVQKGGRPNRVSRSTCRLN